MCKTKTPRVAGLSAQVILRQHVEFTPWRDTRILLSANTARITTRQEAAKHATRQNNASARRRRSSLGDDIKMRLLMRMAIDDVVDARSFNAAASHNTAGRRQKPGQARSVISRRRCLLMRRAPASIARIDAFTPFYMDFYSPALSI